ncbi:hypothetical protein [Aeromicrobium sp. UC242_57]|uniref:hypothetical protein n=1 Tax=Aeromicrobium sp. UC242_57 TaxID=3374624 RepID=UPI0037C0CF62
MIAPGAGPPRKAPRTSTSVTMRASMPSRWPTSASAVVRSQSSASTTTGSAGVGPSICRIDRARTCRRRDRHVRRAAATQESVATARV